MLQFGDVTVPALHLPCQPTGAGLCDMTLRPFPIYGGRHKSTHVLRTLHEAVNTAGLVLHDDIVSQPIAAVKLLAICNLHVTLS